MDSVLVTIGLPVALAIIMLGLGLSLTPADFARVAKHPRAVIIALGCQLVLLPVIAFGLVAAFGLAPLLAVGFMILAASPGGTTANLFSHLFRGDVALNITLTAVNSAIAVVTLPLVTNLALAHFLSGDDSIDLQLGKVAQVFAVVLVPVGAGMLVRRYAPGFAARMDKPVRIASAVILLLVIVGAVLGERENLADYLARVGLIATVFCLLSLSIGYVVPRLFGVSEAQAVASSFEIGVHNSTLAIAMALTVLESTEMAIPAAIYGVLMFLVATAFGFVITRRSKPARGADLDDRPGASSAAR